MAYKQGYTNVKNVLADFVSNICFDRLAADKFETWQLLYPNLQNEKEAFDWILNNRRATISATFVPQNQWQEDEVIKVNQTYLDSFFDYKIENFSINEHFLNKYTNFIEIKMQRIPTDLNIELDICNSDTLNSIQTFRYNADKNILNLNEFYIEDNTKTIFLLKSNFENYIDNENFIQIKYNIKPTFELPLTHKIYDNEAIKVTIKGHKGLFYINNDIDKISTMEFFVDMSAQKLILLKDTIKLSKNEEFIFLVSYQTFAAEAMTWYVDFNYPEFFSDGEKNYNYFEWTFGNSIDEETYHVVNKKKTPPILKCFWHTTNKLKIAAADWLPIEYFMAWDDSAVSFVMCEDPITDLNVLIHSFNYIGNLESIKNAEYDDIKSNFGSCASYDMAIRALEGSVIQNPSTQIKANITFMQRVYDSYFNEKGVNQILLKMNNAAYGNYSISTEIPKDENLLQTSIQQFKIGDAYIDSKNSRIKTRSPIGTTMSMHNIFREEATSYFILPKDLKIVKSQGNSKIEYQLANLSECFINAITHFIIPSNMKGIFLVKDAHVYDKMNDKNIILKNNTEIIFSTNVDITYENGAIIQIPSNTTFKTVNGYQYNTITSAEIVCNLLIFRKDSIFITKEDILTYRPDELTVTAEEVIPKNTSIKLVTDYAEIKFDLTDNYTVEFQYRDPFKGSMSYNFPSEWFNGTRSENFNNFDGHTDIVEPILAEPMIDNSNFKNTIIIKDNFSGSANNKKKVIDSILLNPDLKNNYHYNKVIAPETITNSQTGESWFLLQPEVYNPAIEKDNNSITNICMYPKQVYVGNFCYKKRTMNKCTVALGPDDRERLRLVLIDSKNEVLIDFDGDQTYKNMSITRNLDNGLTLSVDFDSPQDEKVYLGIYKLNNYYKSHAYSGSAHANYYMYVYNLNLKTYFNYEKLNEYISTVYNYSYWFGQNSLNTAYDYYSEIPIDTTFTPDAGKIIPKVFKYITIDLSSKNKTFDINVNYMENLANIWA